MYGIALGLVSALLFGASTPASKVRLGSFDPYAHLALYEGQGTGSPPPILTRLHIGQHCYGCLRACCLPGGSPNPVSPGAPGRTRTPDPLLGRRNPKPDDS